MCVYIYIYIYMYVCVCVCVCVCVYMSSGEFGLFIAFFVAMGYTMLLE